MDFDRLRRVNYTPPTATTNCLSGEAVRADFDQYHLPAAKAHHKALHGVGVAAGLGLSLSGGKLAVEPGSAVDQLGRLVVLSGAGRYFAGEGQTSQVVPVLMDAPTATGVTAQLVVTIEFAEDGRAEDPASPQCGMVELVPWIRLPLAGVDVGDALILGVATVAADGKFQSLNKGGRTAVGQVAASLRLRRPDDSRGAVGEIDAGGLTVVDSGLRLSTTNPHKVTAEQVGALPIGGGHVSGLIHTDGSLIVGKVASSSGTVAPFFPSRGLSIHNGSGTPVVFLGTGRLAIFPFGPDKRSGLLKITSGTGSGQVLITADETRGGIISLVNAQGALRATFDGTGQKSFVASHPDGKSDIVYTALEGPEAAAYLRGRARLEAGSARVVFPDHFAVVVNPETLTVKLTPCSERSLGLAVLARGADGFDVRELSGGSGTYEFDFLVMGVRRGMEHLMPIVPKHEPPVGPGSA